MKRHASADVVTVQVRDIFARCPECGDIRFRKRRAHAGSNGIVYTCIGCDTTVSRAALMNQIGETASRRARAALTSLGRDIRRKKRSG